VVTAGDDETQRVRPITAPDSRLIKGKQP
jgi:hypothetical protein